MSGVKGLVHLTSQNPILLDTLKLRILEGKREACEVSFSDFDDVSFKISVNPDSLSVVKINMSMRNASSMKRLGVDDYLLKLFPGMVVQADAGFEFAIQFDCSNLSDPQKTLDTASDLKSLVLGYPIHKAFTALEENKLSEISLTSVPYRKSESFYICPSSGKIVIVFLIDFVDPTDRTLARVFLQQFVEAQRKERTAPTVAFSRDPPGELSSLNLHGYQDASGFFSFGFEPRHIAGVRKDKAVTLLTGFRTYIHYHLKCSKTYLHMRMRTRVAGWLQVLNRAMPSTEQDKKTAAGKTFTRK